MVGVSGQNQEKVDCTLSQVSLCRLQTSNLEEFGVSAYSVRARVPNLGAFDRHLCTKAPSVGEGRSFSLYT